MAKRRATRAAEATLREELEAIGARLAQLGELARGGEQAYDALVGTVRRQPLGSLATAFAVGLAAAMLFGHRR